MNKFIKINKLLFLLLFIYSCGVGEALQGKKWSDQGDEFLIDKKNPLAMPPDFDKLPIPGETTKKTINETQNDQSNIENLLKKSADEQENESSQSSSSIENSILKKIK